MCDMASVKVSANLNDGYKFYRNVLKSPKYVVAPMVAQSEVAWRMMARKHGAHLCYTPMCSANTFLNDKNYRNEVLQDISCKEDRPLIVQFCANTAEKFIKAALAVQDHCDGVDLNLGCPQHIALRALESVEPGRVYVLGGLVDETVTKKLTLDSANESEICTRRSPVVEHMTRSGRHSNYSTVYCVNQVFDMLLAYHVTQDWKSALSAGAPPRKGYVFENTEEIETTS